MAEPIKFVDDSEETALAECIADYQRITGRTLGNADPEMLLINAFAYRVARLREQLNWTGNQNLISFATGQSLEQLGMKSGTFKLDAFQAVVTITFSIETGAPTLILPQGMRVKSQDGKAFFAVDEDTNVVSGTTTIDVACTCIVAGTVGNGYTPGLINVIVDPQPYVTGCVNADTSSGGSDQESDDQLRERIPLASATYSVAGPYDGYVFYAKSASPAIVDVSVTVPVPGQINIYPLLKDGVIPGGALLTAVEDICSDKKVRPLSDTVTAVAPTQLDYTLTVQLTLKKGYNSAETANQVLVNLQGFVNQWDNALGVDVMVTQVLGKCSIPGVYDVVIPDFTADLLCDDTEFAYCTSLSVTVVAIVDEP